MKLALLQVEINGVKKQIQHAIEWNNPKEARQLIRKIQALDKQKAELENGYNNTVLSGYDSYQ